MINASFYIFFGFIYSVALLKITSTGMLLIIGMLPVHKSFILVQTKSCAIDEEKTNFRG